MSFAEFKELIGIVGAISVKEQEACMPYLFLSCMPLKVLEPLKAEKVIRIATIRDPKNRIVSQGLIRILTEHMNLALENQEC